MIVGTAAFASPRVNIDLAIGHKLLKNLGKTKADDEPLSLLEILKSNGLDDALWCCRAEPQYDKEWRLFAVWCASQVKHLMRDNRSIEALDVATRYANGCATIEELEEAQAASWDAAQAASKSASKSAATSAATAAARSAAWSAAQSAAWNAAQSASWDAGRAAAWNAGPAASQSAAWDAGLATAKSNQDAEFLRIVA